MHCSYAPLDEGKLNEIKDFEKKLGNPLLAFSCHDMKPADLSEDQLSELKTLETRLGVVLVAVA